MAHEVIVSAGASKKVKAWYEDAGVEGGKWAGILTGESMLSTGKTVKSPTVSDVGEAMTEQDVAYAEAGAKQAAYPKVQAAIAAQAVKLGMPGEESAPSQARSAEAL